MAYLLVASKIRCQCDSRFGWLDAPLPHQLQKRLTPAGSAELRPSPVKAVSLSLAMPLDPIDWLELVRYLKQVFPVTNRSKDQTKHKTCGQKSE